MTNILHKISPKHTRIIAAVLSLVLVLGAVSFIAPVEAQALAIDASDSGYYNVAYETNGETTFGDGTRIRVINQTRANKSKSDAVYTLGTTGWAADNTLVWDGTGENTIYGIYPYNASYDKFTIPAEQSGGVQDADWMTATYTGAKPSNKSVALHFNHLLTKVTIKVNTWGSEYGDTTKTVTEAKIYSLATDIKKDDSGAATANTASLTAITPLYDETEKTYTAIICPGTYAEGQKIMSLTVNDTDSLTVLANANQSLTTEGGLKPGYHYTFELTVGKNQVEIKTVKVTDWINREIDGVESEEVGIGIEMNGTTATVTISDFATDVEVKNAIAEVITAGATELMIKGEPTAAQQEAIAAALTGKSGIALIMSEVTAPATAITALTDIDLAYKNGAGDNGYAIANGTYIITAKSGLDSWRTAVASNASLNLTLACDIEYNGNWKMPSVTFEGVIDGNGYAIKGLSSNGTTVMYNQYSTFILKVGNNGVIKHLGMEGGTRTNDDVGAGSGSYGFCYENNGTIMGCYNTSTCTSTTKSNYYGSAAGFCYRNNGKIIACYNAGTMTTGGDCTAGISTITNYLGGGITGCYNTGAVSTQSDRGDVAAAITATNHNTINDCYYTQPSIAYRNFADYSPVATNITKWSSSDWTTPMNTMNAAIEEYNKTATVKCNYEYVINTDAATKDAQPLIIVEVE